MCAELVVNQMKRRSRLVAKRPGLAAPIFFRPHGKVHPRADAPAGPVLIEAVAELEYEVNGLEIADLQFAPLLLTGICSSCSANRVHASLVRS